MVMFWKEQAVKVLEAWGFSSCFHVKYLQLIYDINPSKSFSIHAFYWLLRTLALLKQLPGSYQRL